MTVGRFTGRLAGKHRRKGRRGIELLSAFGLVSITGGAVGALGWRAVIMDDPTAANSLAMVATSGLAGLLVLAGAKRKQAEDDEPSSAETTPTPYPREPGER